VKNTGVEFYLEHARVDGCFFCTPEDATVPGCRHTPSCPAGIEPVGKTDRDPRWQSRKAAPGEMAGSRVLFKLQFCGLV